MPSGKVLSINISSSKGTIKHPVNKAKIKNSGIVGDAHTGNWHRQISLLDYDHIIEFQKKFNKIINPGEFAENLTIQGIDLTKISIGDIFIIGKNKLEVTQIGKQCHGHKCNIFNTTGDCIMPKEGIFCRVINGGTVTAGDTIEYLPKIWKILIITLSDRAFNGAYKDQSGPVAQEILTNFCNSKNWQHQINTIILPDSRKQLKKHLFAGITDGAAAIFTLGSTGVGLRDIAPEIITNISDKIIPGIMENIRRKYSENNINALLSRSVACIKNQTQIYSLPGNPRAVAEYLEEILKTLEHLFLMLNQIDLH